MTAPLIAELASPGFSDLLCIDERPTVVADRKFQLRLFGQFRLDGPQGRIELGSRKLPGLLAYLVCTGQEQHRDRAMTLLWGAHSQLQARQNLRQALTRLRRVLGNDAIVGGANLIGIRAGLIECDVIEFERLVRAGDPRSLADALSLFAGPFFDNADFEEESWSEWLRAQQRRLDALAIDAALTSAADELRHRRWAKALELAERAIAIDNLREDAYRLAIQALAAAGRRSDALKRFDGLVALLKTELNVGPEPATRSLVRQLRLSDSVPAAPASRPAPAAGSSPSPARPSIAVLPFADNSETDHRYFADGIVEDIVLSLASMHELFVISRGSTLRLRVDGAEVGNVGRALGVRYVVTGSVRRSADRLRLWVELSDADSGEIVWTERMDSPLGEIFAVQDQIVADTVAHIAPSIRNAELKRALRKPPEKLSAYDWSLRALDLIFRLDREAFEDAVVLFDKAREIEPAFALPYAWTAWIHMHRIALGWSQDERADVEKATRLAQSAVRIDDRNARALATLGHLRSFFHHELDDGHQYVTDALTACPNDPFCWAISSASASYGGRTQEAVAHAQKALRLSPFDKYRFYYRAALGLAHYVAGEYDEAIRCASIAREENPGFTSNLRYLAASLAAAGRLQEAGAVGRSLRSRQRGFTLRGYRARMPFNDGGFRELHLEHLRLAGLPDKD
jgi:TolB-like protein